MTSTLLNIFKKYPDATYLNTKTGDKVAFIESKGAFYLLDSKGYRKESYALAREDAQKSVWIVYKSPTEKFSVLGCSIEERVYSFRVVKGAETFEVEISRDLLVELFEEVGSYFNNLRDLF